MDEIARSQWEELPTGFPAQMKVITSCNIYMRSDRIRTAAFDVRFKVFTCHLTGGSSVDVADLDIVEGVQRGILLQGI
jgi:hypothetical protein